MKTYEQRLFNWRIIEDRTLIHPELLCGLTMPEEELALDEVRRQAVYSIRTHVLSYDLPGHIAKREHTVIYRVPTTPWQMFKEQHQYAWWMRWLVARRPVLKVANTRRIEFTAEWKDYAVYPWQQVVPAHPKLGTPVRHVQLATEVKEHFERQTPPPGSDPAGAS